MQLQWDNTYTTGDAEIDSQHQQIFAYLNELSQKTQHAYSEKWAKDFMETLIHFIRNHFYFEEMVMRKKACPVIKKNQEQHAKLLHILAEQAKELAQHEYDVDSLMRLQTFLSHWFMRHTLHVDIKLRDCI